MSQQAPLAQRSCCAGLGHGEVITGFSDQIGVVIHSRSIAVSKAVVANQTIHILLNMLAILIAYFIF
jgi:hypothetical protein